MLFLKTCCRFAPLQTGTLAIGGVQVLLILLDFFQQSNRSFLGSVLALAATAALIYGAKKVRYFRNIPKYSKFSIVINAIQKQRYYLIPWLISALIGCIVLTLALLLLIVGTPYAMKMLTDSSDNEADQELARESIAIIVIALIFVICERTIASSLVILENIMFAFIRFAALLHSGCLQFLHRATKWRKSPRSQSRRRKSLLRCQSSLIVKLKGLKFLQYVLKALEVHNLWLFCL